MGGGERTATEGKRGSPEKDGFDQTGHMTAARVCCDGMAQLLVVVFVVVGGGRRHRFENAGEFSYCDIAVLICVFAEEKWPQF